MRKRTWDAINPHNGKSNESKGTNVSNNDNDFVLTL